MSARCTIHESFDPFWTFLHASLFKVYLVDFISYTEHLIEDSQWIVHPTCSSLQVLVHISMVAKSLSCQSAIVAWMLSKAPILCCPAPKSYPTALAALPPCGCDCDQNRAPLETPSSQCLAFGHFSWRLQRASWQGTLRLCHRPLRVGSGLECVWREAPVMVFRKHIFNKRKGPGLTQMKGLQL